MFNIMYAGDRLTLRGIYLSIRSIVEHNAFPIHFSILTMAIEDKGEKGRAIKEEDRLFLEKTIQQFNKDSVVTLHDFSKRYQDTLQQTRNHKCKFSPYCMLRLFSESIIPDENILYLDADTLIIGSLLEFNKIDISQVELAACPDYLAQWWVRPGYFNSGVLWINGINIKKTHLFERSLKLLTEKTYNFADQTALNNLIESFVYLPRKFNEQRPIKKDSIVCHFCNRVLRFWSPIRPWDIRLMREVYKIKEFDNVYKDYLEKFPFKETGIPKPDYKL
jgi:lipopolysaccharide biosynthesis glycosyltransferase